MRALSLFTGGGGLDLAAEWAGIHTVAMCEREQFPRAVLAKHWPGIPIYDDVKMLTAQRLKEDGVIGPDRAIDLIHGGFPCQPFSHAGRRAGTEDDRYLWPEMLRIISEVQPTWVVAENVAGLLSMVESESEVIVEDKTTICKEALYVVERVRRNLAEKGYDTVVIVLPASAVGAPHKRERIFIVGHTERVGFEGQPRRGTEPKLADRYFAGKGGIMADTPSEGLSGWRRSAGQEGNAETGAGKDTRPERCSETLADTESNSQGGLPIGEGEEDAGLTCSGENVADTPGGRRKQARELRPDQSAQRTPGSREDVAYAAGRGRSGPGESIVPGDTAPDRAGEAGQSINVRIRTERPTQPGVGGIADGLSAWLDRYRPRNLRQRPDGWLEVLWPALMHEEQHDYEPPRVATGIKNRAARLKLLGNAVSPAQAYPIFYYIKQIHDSLINP